MPVLRFSALLVAIVLAISGSAVGVAAAQSSLPGSPFYSVKRAGESLRLTLTTSPDQRAILHMDFAQARLAETLALLDSQQPADERVLDDLAREYELAWANIQLLPAGEAQAQRERFIAEGQIEIAALTEALGRAPHISRPAIEAALRSNQATLIQATEKERPTLPKSPAGDHTSTPGHDASPGNSQGNKPAPTKSPTINPRHGQGNGNGHGGGGGDHPSPVPADQPDKPGNSDHDNVHGNGQGDGNGQGQNQDHGNGQGNGGGDHPNPVPADPPDKPGNSDQNGGSGNNQDNKNTTPNDGDNIDGGDKSKDNDKNKNKDKDKAPRNG
jgi:hypothetical protein